MSLNLLAVSEHSASQQTAMQPTSAVWRQASSVTAVQSSPRSEREPTNTEIPAASVKNVNGQLFVALTGLSVECCWLLDAHCLTPGGLGQHIGDGDLDIVQPGRGEVEAVQLPDQVVGELLHCGVKLEE